MQTLFMGKSWKNRGILPYLFCSAFFVFMTGAYLHAGAPARAIPYAESRCSTDPNIFYCEDFEGNDLRIYGYGDNRNYYRNPAFELADMYNPMGGSHQHSAIPLPGFNQGTNLVWRVAKSGSGFTDILWGNNTGTGSGTLNGYLSAAVRGAGITDWYHRQQVWFSSDFSWPATLDLKLGWTTPKGPTGQVCADLPGCPWEGGMGTTQDTWCSGTYYPPSGQNFEDSLSIRYGKAYDHYPYQNDGCPALPVGSTPDGTHMWRFQKNRWYTVEYHYKLSSSPSANDGMIEMWVDGVKVFSQTRQTCTNGCQPLWYVGVMVWMNSADAQTGYVEVDNFVMSRRYIGPPGGSPSAANTPPAPPTGLSAILQ